MELRHLRYFVAVAEEQNITRAAHRLNVSQPPLSRQVRDLECELGVTLLVRGAKSVKLTPAGRLFLDEARAVLQRADEAVRAVQALASERAEDLHVGYAPSPSVELLPEVLRAFEGVAPGVRVVLHDLTSAEMIAGLEDGSLGAALLVGHSRPRRGGLEFRRLRTYRVGVLVARGHALCRRRSIRPEALASLPMVVYSRVEYPDYHEMLLDLLGESARRLRIVQECDGAFSLISAVEVGRGVALVAESAAIVAGKRAAFIPFEPAPAPMEVGVSVRTGATGVARLFFDTASGLASPRGG